MENSEGRIVWLDALRVAAMFLVLLVHSTEPFYLGGEGSLILTRPDAFWVSFFDSFARACVPLFVVASSYLLFPLRRPTGEFLRRRAVRVLIPFVLWSLVYAVVWGEPVHNLRSLLLNFNYAAGHLWFVYMIFGLYLLMPLLSPWAEKVSRKELLLYLGICLFTTLIPIFRSWLGGSAPVIYGPTGIPNPAKYPLWGEASWNSFGLFYYFSGFIGYLLLGLYLRRFVGELSWGRTLAVALPVWLAGFAVTAGGFLKRVFADAAGTFPVEGPTGLAALWETTWLNDTVGVALMTVGWILIFRKMNGTGALYEKVVRPLSQASYGVYLAHMVLLVPVSAWLRTSLGVGAEGVLGIWTTPAQILLTALVTFVSVSLFSVLVRRIPKIGKYIVG